MTTVNPKVEEEQPSYINEEEKKEDDESDKKLNNIEIELEEIA